MKTLVIVESPTKAKTISGFLGDDFVIQSSFGHIRDLPKSELGIDTEKDFSPKYIIPLKARKNANILKKEAKKADAIILATDEDREGEAIAWHVLHILGLEKKKQKDGDTKKIQRIVFHEITKNAINEALKNPREIDLNLVNAQQARRILDRLVGYKISPILWKRFYRGLSAGRVQSVTVRLIVEREREIEKFKPDEYWSIDALFKTESKETLPAHLSKIDDKPLEKLSIRTKNEAETIVKDLSDASFTIINVDRKETMRMSSPPFTTSTLQQTASKRFHYSSKQTMVIAQQLYEAGHITYMRTDSVNLSKESLATAKQHIVKQYGEKYSRWSQYKTKTRSAQEAHEAIRPTNPSNEPESLKDKFTPQQLRLYTLIWQRFIASQMSPAIFDTTGIDIVARQYTFRANGNVLKFDGFLKVFPVTFEDAFVPLVHNGDHLALDDLTPEQHFTKPPPRYTEASLIKILESEGIGRPSTYAAIISTILTRKYVERDRSRTLRPTESGFMVNDFLVEYFPDVVDVKFTSRMEDQLDAIADGKAQWIPTVSDFYGPFSEKLKDILEKAASQKEADLETTDLKCDKCGKPMIIRRGRFGKFTACSDFPTCKNILKGKKAEPEKVGKKCEKCGSEFVYRVGRFGKFIACSNYPECKNTQKIKKGSEKEESEKIKKDEENTESKD